MKELMDDFDFMLDLDKSDDEEEMEINTLD